MSIFSGLFRTRDAPTNRTSGSAYSFFMGSSTAGKNVNERSAMQMTAVYACVRILSEAIAGLPLHVYHYNSDGGKEKALNHNLCIGIAPQKQMCHERFPENKTCHFRVRLIMQQSVKIMI